MPTVLVTYPCAVLHDSTLSITAIRRISEPADRALVNNPSPLCGSVQLADSLTTRARHFAGFSTQCREFRHGPRADAHPTFGPLERSIDRRQ